MKRRMSITYNHFLLGTSSRVSPRPRVIQLDFYCSLREGGVSVMMIDPDAIISTRRMVTLDDVTSA